MNNENKDGGNRPPYVDPLSGATVTFPAAETKKAAGWTPPPHSDSDSADKALGHDGDTATTSEPDTAGVTDAEVDDAINAVMGMLHQNDNQTQHGADDPLDGLNTGAEQQHGTGQWNAPPKADLTDEAEPQAADDLTWLSPEEMSIPFDFGTTAGANQSAYPSGSESPYYGADPISGFDPKTAAAMAAMAAMLADFGRTTSLSNYQLPSAQEDFSSDDYYGFENVVGSIMMEDGQNGSGKNKIPASMQDDVTDIVTEVQGWEGDSANTQDDSEDKEESSPNAHAWIPTEQEQAPDKSADLAAQTQTPETQTEQEPSGEQTEDTDVPPYIQQEKEESEPQTWSRQGRRKRPKPKIAKESRAKGMRGNVNFEKTSVNVAVQVKTMASPTRSLPIFLLVLLGISTFSWFGVIQLLGQIDIEQAKLFALEQQRNGLNQAVSGFAAVQSEYALYGSDWMSLEEKLQVDAAQVLAVVEDELLLSSRVSRINMEKNLLTVEMSGVTLNSTAAAVKRLEQLAIVRSVFVYLAEGDKTSNVITAGGYEPEYPIIGLPAATGDAMDTNITMEISLWLPGSTEPENEPAPGSIDAPKADAAQAPATTEGGTTP